MSIDKGSAFVGVLFLLLVACGTAVAQSCPKATVSCAIYSLDGKCTPTLPATAYACYTSGPFSAACTVNTSGCAPRPECPTCNKGGSPIDLATGDTYITQVDLRIPGLGGGLNLTRTWNSIVFEGALNAGMFGAGWSSTFEETVFAGTDGYMKYARSDGGVWSLGFTSQSNNLNFYAVAGPASQTATLTQADGNWTLAFQNGEKRVFDATTGKLLSITDRNGNSTQLTYDASSRLVTATDPASRHLYFAYSSPSSFLVSSVSSDFGVSLSYTYDAQARLIKVTEPDQTTVSYQYDSSSRITAVLDSNGKVLESHTYNACGQGLTSSRAGGIDSVTVSYPSCTP